MPYNLVQITLRVVQCVPGDRGYRWLGRNASRGGGAEWVRKEVSSITISSISLALYSSSILT